MHVNEEYESEINLKHLFFYILYRWRSLLIFALIGAIGLGTFQWYKLKSTHDAGKQTKEEREYELEKKKYWADVNNLKYSIKVSEEYLNNQKTYINESIWMQMDPQEVWSASCTYLVKVAPEVMEAIPEGANVDPADNILMAYNSPLADTNDKELMEVFEAKDAKYARELIGAGVNLDRNTVNVSVTGPSEEYVKKGLKFLKKLVEGREEKAQGIEAHELLLMAEEVTHYRNTDLAASQEGIADAIEKREEDLQETRLKLDELEDKEEPKAPGTHIKKMAAIGFLLAGFLLAFIYAMKFVLQGKLTDAEDLSGQFGLPVLGNFVKSGSIHKNRTLDKLFYKWERGRNKLEDETVYNNICALLSEQENGKELLLVSTLPAETIAPVQENLSSRLSGRSIKAEGSFLSNSGAIQAASEAEAVILVESKQVSYTGDIRKMAETLLIDKANVIGAIVL